MTKSIDLIPTWYWPDGVPRYLSPTRSSVYASTVGRWARRKPNELAVRGSRDLSYGELDELVRSASARFRLNLPDVDDSGQAQRLAVITGNDVESVVAILGALHAGTDALLLDHALTEAQLTAALTRFQCRLVVGNNAPPSSDWATITLEDVLKRTPEDTPSTAESRNGRLALSWNDSFALQPNSILMGWASAFRAFTVLDNTDLFTVFRSLSSWEGLLGVLAPLSVGATCLLPTVSPDSVLRSITSPSSVGAWLDWSQVEALLSSSAPGFATPLDWIYWTVDRPIPVRKRRRLNRLLGAQILTIFGTPASGPVAATPREWSIDSAVGTPVTGVDLLPLGEGPTLANPPWHLLAGASIGAKSSYFVPEVAIEGPASARVLPDGLVDTNTHGRVDANGMLYLL